MTELEDEPRPDSPRPTPPDDETACLPQADKADTQLPGSDETKPSSNPTDSTPTGSHEQEKLTTAESLLGTPPFQSDEGGPRRPALPAFFPNQVVAGRYRIVRFIGQGGMAEVYQAEDLELRERVALKILRPEIAEDQRAIERLKREIHLARKVTHPNVCRIFDFGYQQAATLEGSASPESKLTFLTMEFLSGETLAARLWRVGRMTTTEALPLLGQATAALTAAHKAGVVHRDFKPGNVLLVPSEEGGIRAVVTDFGLARRITGRESLATSVAGTGEISGTWAYMAPEQVEGGETTCAADIYALGVVMYEMLTGCWPFEGDTPIATAVKRLNEPPPSPRIHVPGLDAKWERAILRCLERNPADRFTSAADVVKALAGEEVAGPKRALEEQKRAALEGNRQQRRRLAFAGITLSLILVSALGYHLRISRKLQTPMPQVSGLPVAPIKARRSVAVLGFKNLSGRPDAAWLSTALSEMLTTELAAGGKLRTIPGENVSRMKIELSLADADSLAKDTLGRIQKNLGADFVVLGSYLDLGKESAGKTRLDLRLQDTAEGETIAVVSETGTEANLLDLVSQAGAQLREKLKVEVFPAEAGGVRASLPSNSQAVRLYSEGLEKLRLFDPLAARDLLEKAVAADPGHALAHSALAAAWSALGYDGKAKAEAKRAFDLSANLPHEDSLSIEARYREMTHEWDRAVEIYRTLWLFFPDNLDYGNRLAGAQIAAGRGKEALVTVAALRRLPPPARDSPQIDLAEAGAAESLADFKREQAVAAEAADKGAARRARLLVARARVLEGEAFRNLGEPKRAMGSYEEAKRIYTAASDRGGVARTLNDMATVISDMGDFAGAKKMYEESLAVCREIGDKAMEAGDLRNIGIVLKTQGDLVGAKKMYEQAVAIFREIGNKKGVAEALNNIAVILRNQGDLTGAARMYAESLAVSRQIGDKDGVARACGNIATVLYYQGKLAGSKKMHEEALATYREIGKQSDAAMETNNIANILADQGDLTSAKKMFEQALAIFRQMGDKNDTAEALSNIAGVVYNQGDLAGAHKMFEESLAIFRETGNKSGAAYALFCLGEVLSAEGDLSGARKTHEEALAIRNELGEKGSAAASLLDLAALSIEENRPADAGAPARKAAKEFRAEKQAVTEAFAHEVLARALLAQGRLAEAKKTISRATTLPKNGQNLALRLSVAITAARVRAATGKSAEPRKSLESTLAEAKKYGYLGYQLEARLALGEIEMKSGNAAAGRTRLAALEKEATAKGFGLIARKAAVAVSD